MPDISAGCVVGANPASLAGNSTEAITFTIPSACKASPGSMFLLVAVKSDLKEIPGDELSFTGRPTSPPDYSILLLYIVSVSSAVAVVGVSYASWRHRWLGPVVQWIKVHCGGSPAPAIPGSPDMAALYRQVERSAELATAAIKARDKSDGEAADARIRQESDPQDAALRTAYEAAKRIAAVAASEADEAVTNAGAAAKDYQRGLGSAVRKDARFRSPLTGLAADWKFSDAWATNVGAAGALFTGVLGTSSVLEKILGKDQADSATVLSVVSAAITAVLIGAGPVILSATRKLKYRIDTEDGEAIPKGVPHTTVGGLLLAAICVLGGTAGQILVMATILDDAFAHDYYVWFPAGAASAVLTVYTYRTIPQTVTAGWRFEAPGDDGYPLVRSGRATSPGDGPAVRTSRYARPSAMI